MEETTLLKIHGASFSTCTARVLLCLAEKGLDYELVPVDMNNKAHKKLPFLSLNPFGQIPVMEDGDLTLFESRAINKYISQKHKDKGTDLLGSNNFKESTIVDQWMEVEAHKFNGPMSKLMHEIIISPMLGSIPDEDVVTTHLDNIEKVLDVYDQVLSKTKYIAGDYYTLADLHHIPYFVYFMNTKHSVIVTSRPHVSSWWNDISSRPATVKVASAMKLD